jgi:choline kinase
VQNSNTGVGVAVDTDFREYWEARLEKPEEDDESFEVGPDGNVVELGTPYPFDSEMYGRYVGIIKFSGEGTEVLRRVYHEQRDLYYEKDEPWLNSKSFKKGYMTDMIQALINAGVRVDPIDIQRGWLEFDTVEDYELYQEWMNTGAMERFITL